MTLRLIVAKHALEQAQKEYEAALYEVKLLETDTFNKTVAALLNSDVPEVYVFNEVLKLIHALKTKDYITTPPPIEIKYELKFSDGAHGDSNYDKFRALERRPRAFDAVMKFALDKKYSYSFKLGEYYRSYRRDDYNSAIMYITIKE